MLEFILLIVFIIIILVWKLTMMSLIGIGRVVYNVISLIWENIWSVITVTIAASLYGYLLLATI